MTFYNNFVFVCVNPEFKGIILSFQLGTNFLSPICRGWEIIGSTEKLEKEKNKIRFIIFNSAQNRVRDL